MGVGIDIGSKTIKIVELEKMGNSFALKGSGVVGYTGKTLEHMSDDKELTSMAEVIRKLHKEARISSKEIVISLSEPQVFTRTIKFPLLSDQEIASAVKWEAEQYIPIPVAEAVVQHQIIERRETTTPPEVLVLLIAAPEVLVEKYVRVIQLSGLVVSAVETELMAMSRAVAPENTTILLLDFGARSTDIAIVRNRNLVFTRSIPTAGDAFTRAVAQSLGMEQTQAEEYKKAYGLTSNQLEGKIKGAIDPVVRMVTDEIKKSIHFYQTEEKGDTPKLVLVSGGTAGMPEIVSLLSRELNMEVGVANPFANVSMAPEAAKVIANYAPLYTISVGLAMRGG